MEPLKNTYANKMILSEIARDFKKVYPALDEKAFSRALTQDLDTLELKARFERVADSCKAFLPEDYPKAIQVMLKFCEGKPNKLIYLFMPTFIMKYGRGHYELSMKALRDVTEYSSSEEGVRPFLEDDLKKTIKHMLTWTKSKNTHIRRLASEGSRPRLPWAKKVQALIDDPTHAWPLLEALKTDKEKYVQKSVANHINDISKDHADWVVEQVSSWDQSNEATAWIIKHGMRTLIKQGHKGALKIFGTHAKPKLKIKNVKWDEKVKLGEKAQVSFEIVSDSSQKQSLVVDYNLFFSKKDGKSKAKIFKLKTLQLAPKEKVTLKAHYAFKDYTTRKHYPGEHAWQPLINGESFKIYPFQVV